MTEKKLSEKMREVVGDPEKNIEFIVKNDGWVEQAKELEEKLAEMQTIQGDLAQYCVREDDFRRNDFVDLMRQINNRLLMLTDPDRPTAEPAGPPPSAVGLMVSHTKHCLKCSGDGHHYKWEPHPDGRFTDGTQPIRQVRYDCPDCDGTGHLVAVL